GENPRHAEQEKVRLLAHELAHLLGVFHCSDPHSLMHSGMMADTFDAYSLEILKLTRGYDFREDGRGIDLATARRMAAAAARNRQDETDAWTRGHREFARLFRLRSAPGTAVELAAEAVRSSPQDMESLLEWGRALLEVQRFTDARAAFARMVDLNDRSPEAHIGLG